MSFTRKRSHDEVQEGYNERGFRIYESLGPLPDDSQKGRANRKDPVLHQTQLENEKMREWVEKEDEFVLQQAKRGAMLRTRTGRATLADKLVVNVRVADPKVGSGLEEDDSSEFEVSLTDPIKLIKSLKTVRDIDQLSRDISQYVSLERDAAALEYWDAVRIMLDYQKGTLDRKQAYESTRAIQNVREDIERLLAPKTFEELNALELRVQEKLRGAGPDMDVDYWQQLLTSIKTYKAESKLRRMFKSACQHHIQRFHANQKLEAREYSLKMQKSASKRQFQNHLLEYSANMDPPLRDTISSSEKNWPVVNYEDYVKHMEDLRESAQKADFVPLRPMSQHTQFHDIHKGKIGTQRNSECRGSAESGDSSEILDMDDAFAKKQIRRLKGMYAQKPDEEEERLSQLSEVEIPLEDQPLFVRQPPPNSAQIRKPKNFNQVVLGFEWTRYNSAHYSDTDRPPKVVQGYRFNLFYPFLEDMKVAPTYKIIRQHAPNHGGPTTGEHDTCIIRFKAGPPYQDVAFRIVDREWDFSAKFDKGSRNSFQDGVLQLHFMFKRLYYRK